MPKFSRRHFLHLGAASVASMAFAGAATGQKPASQRSASNGQARIVIIGGGFAGATAARYLKRGNPKLKVTLVEQLAQFVTCPMSNLVIGGLRTIDKVTFGYDALRRLGVEVVIDKAKGIDTESRMVKLGGGILSYDKLIVAPGIDFRLDVVPGYDSNTAEQLPHAWIAGPATLKLARQIEAMADGGTVIICPPDNPYRCPPAPYERASLIANYLKKYKPRSKILILDAKETFSKQPLFQNAWDLLYPGMITWLAGTVGGAVERVDAAAMTVTAGFGSEKGAVINFIPAQQAGAIAREAGLADDSGWCPADPNTMASNKARDVYVIGDAVKAGILPKSGSVANTEGKAVAAAILAELGDHPPPEPVFANVCYSLAAPDYGFSTTAVYRLTEQGMVDTLQGIGVSPVEAAIDIRRQEAQFASGWYRAITADIWG